MNLNITCLIPESILCQDPRVQSAVIFGRGRFQVGVVIDPAPGVSVNPDDASSLAAFRNSIWCVCPVIGDVRTKRSLGVGGL